MQDAPAIDTTCLRVARERAGLSQNDLARHLGLAGGVRISRWERGEARPRSPELLRSLADVLDVTPRDLLVPPENGPDLRWLRFAAGLTVAQAAAAANCAVSTMKRWEVGGLRSPSGPTITTLCEALGASPDEVRNALRAK